MSSITIQVEPELAQAFGSASPEQQQKIQMLINQWLKQALNTSKLQATMDQMSQEAQAAGLTPEILESILDDQ
jgi:Holliday junction resolvase-like predicted endonuclease